MRQISAFFIDHLSSVFGVGQSFIGFVTGISIVLCIVLFVAIIGVVEALKHIRKKEEEMYSGKTDPAFTPEEVGDIALSHAWRTVMEHMDSDNENDWRQAIIEADIMLEDLLVKLGYRGEGIGERLRRVAPGDFKTLQQAGEAHGVRNRIAHDGSSFQLNKIEAQRVIGLYRQVFEEFYHIV